MTLTAVLVWVTVAYLALLVVAVAVSLIMILVLLRRTSGLLRQVHAALGEVESDTRGIAPVIDELRRLLEPLTERVKRRDRLPAGARVQEVGPVKVIR